MYIFIDILFIIDTSAIDIHNYTYWTHLQRKPEQKPKHTDISWADQSRYTSSANQSYASCFLCIGFDSWTADTKSTATPWLKGVFKNVLTALFTGNKNNQTISNKKTESSTPHVNHKTWGHLRPSAYNLVNVDLHCSFPFPLCKVQGCTRFPGKIWDNGSTKFDIQRYINWFCIAMAVTNTQI